MRYKPGETARTCINSKTKESFKEKTTKGEFTEIWKSNLTPTEKYKKWNSLVLKTAESTFQRRKKKRAERKEIRILKRRKKDIKIQIGEADKETRIWYCKRKN